LGADNCILFCNPNSGFRTEKHPFGRVNVSVRISYDEGQSWSQGKTVYPYASSYTDLVVMPDGSIGLVYERGPKDSTHYWDEIQFARFNLAWVTDRAGSGQRQSAVMPTQQSKHLL
jgi:sialidase-1